MKNYVKINNEYTIINWIVKNRYSNLFYNNYDIDIIEHNIIEHNIIENNNIRNNKIFLVCCIKNKLDIDIVNNQNHHQFLFYLVNYKKCNKIICT